MWATGTLGLAASDPLLAHADLGILSKRRSDYGLQLSSREDLQSPQIVLVQLLDRIEQISVQRHQATLTGAKSRVTVRRSVRVQPCGGVSRSAWSAQSR